MTRNHRNFRKSALSERVAQPVARGKPSTWLPRGRHVETAYANSILRTRGIHLWCEASLVIKVVRSLPDVPSRYLSQNSLDIYRSSNLTCSRYRIDALAHVIAKSQKNPYFCRSSATFSRMGHVCPDLSASRSRATEFSWTSRFQNLKLHVLILILEASHENRPRIGRDISIFVK